MRRKQIQREEKAWILRVREWRTNPNLFRATTKFVCNSLDPIFDNQHTLRTAKTSECSITRLVGETNPASNSHVFKTITIVGVEHWSLQNWTREVQRVSTIVVDLNIKRQSLTFRVESHLHFNQTSSCQLLHSRFPYTSFFVNIILASLQSFGVGRHKLCTHLVFTNTPDANFKVQVINCGLTLYLETFM